MSSKGVWGGKLLLIGLLLALLLPGTGATGSQPGIRFDQDVYIFQPILEGDAVEVAFAFRTVGSQALVIHDVSTSCGCTMAEYPSAPVKPGERGAARTTFNSGGYSGDVDLTLLVKSNDAEEPSKTLHIRGKVVRQWQVKPDRLVLANVAAGAGFIPLLSPPGEVPPGAETTVPYEVHLQGFESGRAQQSSIRVAVANARMALVEIPVLVKVR